MVMSPRASLREALEAITKNGRQAVLVADAEGVLAGMVTDGDLRRAILRGVPLDGVVADIMNPAPVTASPGLGRAAAVELMLARAIRHLPLVDTGRRLVDVLFLEEQIAAPPLPTPAVIMAGGDGRRLHPPGRHPVRRVHAPRRARDPRRGEAAQGVPRQCRHLSPRSVGRRADPGG